MATPSHEPAPRLFVPPLGWPVKFRAVTVTPAERQRRFIILNRYRRQVIGISIRLPDHDPLDASQTYGLHRSLSLMWAKPARWWKN